MLEIGGWGCDTGAKRMTPVPGILRGRAVPCVTCRALRVVRATSRATDQSGHDLGDENSVAKENPTLAATNVTRLS